MGYLQYSILDTSAQDTQHSCKETSPPLLHTATHNNTTTLAYIKLPMYLLFLWHLYLMVLRCATSLLGTLEGVGPENLDFFGPKWHWLRRFRAPKSLDFQGPGLLMPRVMMLHPSNHYVWRHKNRYNNLLLFYGGVSRCYYTGPPTCTATR
jgi:hypothetical protein